jgi:SAM-dependent methyltransferase
LAQDSSKAEFWESRYRDNVTPWDAGKVPASLRAYADNLPPRARILIPGCGSAYDAAYLAKNGFDVLAIDFSPAAIAAAQKTSAGC